MNFDTKNTYVIISCSIHKQRKEFQEYKVFLNTIAIHINPWSLFNFINILSLFLSYIIVLDMLYHAIKQCAK